MQVEQIDSLRKLLQIDQKAQKIVGLQSKKVVVVA